MDIASLIAVVRTVGAAVMPEVPATIEAAKAVVALVNSVASTLGEDDQRQLQQALPALLDRMNAHVDRAVADLRGA